ncbi:serine/arginine repetitive matrix protein 1-like [Acanthaster planci]|uniref:Serine/arginine repetitive matrix protein 1-like n=1 Tax=Acanthaster planci TaxID=133434 RepID=A0A8B7Z1D7_ACAPL|nr:serine/arginine repetitive matrix protein 1-like [Acanthaster planci]
MSDEATKDSQCTCVSKIIKLDPNLLQRRESLFASSEAQSIIEQMTGVSCNGQVILKKTTESQAEDPTEEAPAVETSSTEGKEDNKRVAMTNKSKAGKEREKHTMADVASKVMNSKLYTNDRTTRAVKKWRAFRTREERRLAGEDGQEKHEAKDDKDEKTDEAQSKVGIGDSSPSTASSITTTSAGANTTNTKFSLSRQDENDSNDDIDSDSESDSSDDSETKPTDQPRVATPTPPKSPVLHRPARARFGRRYSMPLNVMTPAPPRLSPAVSPPHGSPKASQESSPNRRPHVTAAITKLQNNREKLSMLFDKRSEVISSLDAESEVVGIGKRVTRLCNRRASDSMSTLSDFLRKQQISLTGSSTGRLLQRRGSVGTNILARNTRTPAVDSSQISPVAPGPNDDNKIRSGRPEFKSRSCEDVAIPNPPGQLHPPPPFHGGRRGSVCVGQIARVRDGTSPELQSPRRPPADGETPLGLICSSKKNVPQERNPDGDSGKDKDTANHKSPPQGPPQRYMKNRRGSVSLAHIAHAREMLQCKTLGNSESQKNGLSKSVPLTLANIEVHNTLLSPFSFQFFSDRIPTTAGAGPVKSEDSPKPAEVSTKPAANQAQGGVHVREGEPKLEGPETAREMGTSSLRQGSSPRRASTPAVPVSERKYSLFLRTDSEIREDIENEIQERVARRRRELMAVRCVSAKGAQRLEARALAQSAAGRLKRNLHEVTKQRKTKELMQIEEERNRLLKQMMLLS